MVRLIYVLFVFSGFIGLMYESLWARYLKLFFGHSSYGQILTLVIYMGGLGIGSFLGGIMAKKARNPFYMYAIVEFCIGIGGLFYHDLYCFASGHFFAFIQQHATLGPAIYQGFKIAIAVVITGPVAVLLGMTFPTLAIGLMRYTQDGGAKTLPGLYFANSFGAAIGIIITSYALIPLLGTMGALTFAAIGNVIIALGFYGIAKNVDDLQKKGLLFNPAGKVNKTWETIDSKMIGFWLMVSGITGFSSFLYEIGWIRLISLLFGSSTHSFDVMISAFIAGLAFGGLYSRRIIRRSPKVILALAWIQVVMGALALWSVYAYKPFFWSINALHGILMRSDPSYIIYSVIKYFLSVLLVCPASFFAGMTLPIITFILFKRFGDEKFTGYVYGWNTMGSILGAVIGGLVLLPLVQLKMTISIGAMIDIVLGVAIFYSVSRPLLYRLAVAVGSAAVIAPVFFMRFDPGLVTAGAFRKYIDYNKIKEKPIVRDGRTATISFHNYKDKMVIRTNGKPDASITTEKNSMANTDMYTQAALAFFPMELFDRPYTAAVIGMGSGMTSHLLLSDTLSLRVDIIEIEKEMFRLARNFMPYNRNVYASPKAHVAFEDAKTFFHVNRHTYDFIVSEPSNPWVSGVSGLFTKEFYRQTAPFLTDDGVMIQWMHLYEFNSDLLLTILKAMDEVFQCIRIYQVPKGNSDIIIVAGKTDFSFKRNARLFSPVVFEQFPELDRDPDIFGERTFLASNKTLKSVLAYYHPNSDYNPLVDNGAEKAFFLKTEATFLNAFNQPTDPYLTFFEPELSKSILILREKYWRKNSADVKKIQPLLCALSSADTSSNWPSLEYEFFLRAGSIRNVSVWDSFPAVCAYRLCAKQNFMPQDFSLRFRVADEIIHGDSLKIAAVIQEALTKLTGEKAGPLIVRLMIGEALKHRNTRLLERIVTMFVKDSPAFEKTEKFLLAGIIESFQLPIKAAR